MEEVVSRIEPYYRDTYNVQIPTDGLITYKDGSTKIIPHPKRMEPMQQQQQAPMQQQQQAPMQQQQQAPMQQQQQAPMQQQQASLVGRVPDGYIPSIMKIYAESENKDNFLENFNLPLNKFMIANLLYNSNGGYKRKSNKRKSNKRKNSKKK